MNYDPTLETLAKQIKARRWKTQTALAKSLGQSITFVIWDLRAMLTALGLMTWTQWRDIFTKKTGC